MSESNYKDIQKMHWHFGLNAPEKPQQLDEETFLYRSKFIQEELDELVVAHVENNLEEQIDALIDIVVVAMGTAHIMGVDWQLHWDEVLRANLSKERSSGPDDPRSKRHNGLDLIKPEGWIPPNHIKILEK